MKNFFKCLITKCSKEKEVFVESVEFLSKCFPQAKRESLESYLPHLLSVFKEYDISTPERKAAFLSQCSHESGQFNRVVENLNYSSDALRRVWPRHFPSKEISDQYHRQPEKIANKAYANRMGNGSESSGEGWKFRGRGLIQVTGKNNYKACGDFLKLALLSRPELLQEPHGAVYSAAWYWTTNKLNLLADKEDVLAITKRINGGTHGLEDRKSQYERVIKIYRETV